MSRRGRFLEQHPKWNRIILNGDCHPEWGPAIQGFREVCWRDGLRANDQLYALIEGWLRDHNWPPGNPQRQLEFTGSPKMLPYWRTCKYGAEGLVNGEFMCLNPKLPARLRPSICEKRAHIVSGGFELGCYRAKEASE
jgi:hypothetical protein